MFLSAKKLTTRIIDKFFWKQHPESALRYLPLVKEIKRVKLQGSKILEIGSGSLGITPYFKKKIDAIDIDFLGPKTNLLNKIKGNAYNLPFKKNTYDVSLSVDVIEHVKPTLRKKTVLEQIRVTKKLALIVVPCGLDSYMQDKRLRKIWNRLFKYKNQFLEEHVKLGLPTQEEIIEYIKAALINQNKKANIRSYPNLNIKVREILMRTWITKSKLLYYLYLKGYLLLVPILRFCNFGKVYRRVFVIEFQNQAG